MALKPAAQKVCLKASIFTIRTVVTQASQADSIPADRIGITDRSGSECLIQHLDSGSGRRGLTVYTYRQLDSEQRPASAI
jgi:hypothetical protein